MDIRILGAYNYESKTTSCTSLLIDGTIAFDAGGFSSNLTVTEQLQMKDVFVSHHHYDHIRDIPSIALVYCHHGEQLRIHCTDEVRDNIQRHILNGVIYPEFHRLPEAKPTIVFNTMTPYGAHEIDGYRIMAMPVQHEAGTVGYEIENGNGNSMFYTGDTGLGLGACWEAISPKMIITEVTFSNRHQELAVDTKHLTPFLLGKELLNFADMKGYLPEVIAIHRAPSMEREIEEEIGAVARDVGAPIGLAREGKVYRV
ncbi:MBL fold metallo-hydrolase [Chloroflexota bacterium]